MAMTSVQAVLPYSPLKNHARPPVIGQEHDFQYQLDHQNKQTLLGQPVKNSIMSSVEQGGGEKPPPCETSPVSQQLCGVEKPPLPPKPSNVVDSVMLTSTTTTDPSNTSAITTNRSEEITTFQ